MAKNNIFKKTKAIILATALILSCLSLSACAGKDKDNQDNPIIATEQATETATEESSTEAVTEASTEATEPTEATEATGATEATKPKSSTATNSFQVNAPSNSTTITNQITTPSSDQGNTSNNTTNNTTPNQGNPSDSSTSPVQPTTPDNSTGSDDEAITITDKNGVALTLTNQSFVDEKTGIQVSGMLPDDSEMYVIFTSKDFMRMSDNFELTIKNEVYKPTADELRTRKEAYNPIDFYSSTDWSLSTEELEADGVPCMQIYFVKDSTVLDFESEFTVTAPIDFRTFASSRNSDQNMFALYFDNDLCEFLSTEVLPADKTPANSFSFKAYTPGKYCIGNEEFLNKYLGYYDLSMQVLRNYPRNH